MEVVGITIIIAVLAVWYGVFNIIEKGANMANREMFKFEAEQINRHNEFFAEMEIDETKADKIAKSRAYFTAQAKM